MFLKLKKVNQSQQKPLFQILLYIYQLLSRKGNINCNMGRAAGVVIPLWLDSTSTLIASINF